MKAQAAADRFAALAKPRLATLLRLSSAQRIYEPTPGALHSTVVESGTIIALDKWSRGVQPYKDLERFAGDDRVVQSIIDPGLLPIAKAISKDVLGRRLLVTRRIAPKENDKGAIAHVEGYGIRVVVYQEDDDTVVAWECLYGVA